MAVKLSRYAEIHDKCCIAYFGPCLEYAVQLRALRPAIEKSLRVQVYLSCRDDALPWLGSDRIVLQSEIVDARHKFAFLWEVAGDCTRHPIEALMDDNCIPINVKVGTGNQSRRCLIATVGISPTRTLTAKQVDEVADMAANQGYSVEFGDSLDGVGWVIGAESPILFEAGCRGIRTTLIPSGLGSSLYNRMFMI